MDISTPFTRGLHVDDIILLLILSCGRDNLLLLLRLVDKYRYNYTSTNSVLGNSSICEYIANESNKARGGGGCQL